MRNLILAGILFASIHGSGQSDSLLVAKWETIIGSGCAVGGVIMRADRSIASLRSSEFLITFGIYLNLDARKTRRRATGRGRDPLDPEPPPF